MSRCPGCAFVLTPVVGPSSSAPWLCGTCRRGWWPSELTAAAVQEWDPVRRCFHHAAVREILVAVEADRQSARSLGTSAIPAHLPLLSDAQLAAVASVIGTNDHPAAVAFAAQVGAQQAGRRQP